MHIWLELVPHSWVCMKRDEASLLCCWGICDKRAHSCGDMQGRPNADFGGSLTEAREMLRQQAWFVPLRVHSPLSNACKAFVRACQSTVRDQAQIDRAFEALPAASYSGLEPHSAAWRELQGKLFAHEAVLWDLTALCCLPIRKQAGVQPPTFSRPSHLMPGAPADVWWICVDPDYCRP